MRRMRCFFSYHLVGLHSRIMWLCICCVGYEAINGPIRRLLPSPRFVVRLRVHIHLCTMCTSVLALLTEYAVVTATAAEWIRTNWRRVGTAATNTEDCAVGVMMMNVQTE